MEAIMKKISTFAALLFLSALIGGPAAFAQATGGDPGMMGIGGHGYGHHDWHQGGGMVAPRIIFSLMDANGDGKLTLEEWQAAQERIFKAMDTDHDGTVTFEEMQAFMHGNPR
jgi:hypothetical protein